MFFERKTFKKNTILKQLFLKNYERRNGDLVANFSLFLVAK